MDIIGFCCAACVAFGDPTAILGVHDGAHAEALASTTFQFASEGPDPARETDGFHLQEARLGLSGNVMQELAFYGAMGANDRGLHGIEAYGDAEPAPGLRIRAGYWLQGFGAVSGRRVEQRCFVDTPMHTERFLGREGLYDGGLQVGYLAPIPYVPVWISGSVLSGQRGLSFQPPEAFGEGADVFERLLYVMRVVANPGQAFGQHLTLGFTFATGTNSTGPSNRTDFIGADISGRFAIGEAWVGFDAEYLMRRYSIPNALYVEGGLTADLVAGWKGLHGGVRLDVMGLPTPPDRSDLQYRVSVAAGYAFYDDMSVRVQYAARSDTPSGDFGHEVTLQAVLGFSTNFAGSGGAPEPTAETRPEPTSRPTSWTSRAEPVPVVGAQPVESADAADWLKAAEADERTATGLAESGRHAPAAFYAQQSAYKALRAVTLSRRMSVDATPRSAVRLLEGLAADGAAPPASLWTAARTLDRHYSASRHPSELGGGPDRYFDRETATDALAAARQILTWTRTQR